MCVCVYIHIYIYTYHLYVCIYIYIHMFYISLSIHIHTYIYIYIYIYTYTHIYIHIHTQFIGRESICCPPDNWGIYHCVDLCCQLLFPLCSLKSLSWPFNAMHHFILCPHPLLFSVRIVNKHNNTPVPVIIYRIECNQYEYLASMVSK